MKTKRNLKFNLARLTWSKLRYGALACTLICGIVPSHGAISTKNDVAIVQKVTQSTIQVKGKIVDSSGEPIIGAAISIPGTASGTVTDLDGNFILNAAPNAKLEISYVGYKNQTLTATPKFLNVVLEEDNEVLDEVVVVGYGVQKKANLTGSVATVNYDQELENRPITDASQALSGKISGVWVSQNSGSPGSDGATLRVRGYGTLNNSDPLVLIDGVEGRLAEVNPNDIGSITVLKDAASAAIYGSRAANGVVLIETKKGSGEKIAVNYNGYIGVQDLDMKYDIVSNSAEYMTLWNSAMTNSGSDPLFPQNVIDKFKEGGDPYRYPNTNYFNEVFRTSLLTQHNLSVTAGGKRSSNYLSVSYMKNDGIMRNTDSERFSLNLNNETKVTDWLKMGARVRLMRKITTQPYNGIGRVIYMMANGHPFSSPYLEDGKTYGGTQALYLDGDKAGQPIVDTRNPFPDLYNGQQKYTNNFAKGNVFATIDFMEGLSLTAQYSGQYNLNNKNEYNELAFTYTGINGENKTKPLDYPSTLYIRERFTDEYYSTFFTNLNFNRIFKEIHDVSAVLGMQQESLDYKFSEAEKTDPAKGDLHQIDSGTLNPQAKGNRYRWRMLSYFGRVNYALMGKYLAEVNLRADGSSRFAKGNRWGYFPSLSAAWRLSEESFMKEVSFLDNFKIRASWGQLGNQNIGNSSNSDYFPYLTTLTQDYANTSYNFGNTLAPGVAQMELVDKDITWETTTTTDIGFDLGLLNNRLNIEFDYFNRKTKDIIVQLPIPLIMGNMKAPFENIGQMSNKGVELGINWSDRIPSADFSYSIGANITYLKNKVLKFREDSPDQLYLIREGYSYKTLYGFNAIGVYQTDEEASEHMHSNSYKPIAGDLKYEDINGDGKLDYQDKMEIGNTIPKWTYGINGNLTWKNFDLNFLFTGIAGVKGYFQNAWTEPLGISGGTITKRWRNAWTKENPSTELPMIRVNDTWNRQESSFWACNLSWFKLKNIQLGYSVPSSFAKKMMLEKFYIYVNATDLFTLASSKYEGFNPERNTFDSGYNHYPTPRVFSFGLNVTF